MENIQYCMIHMVGTCILLIVGHALNKNQCNNQSYYWGLTLPINVLENFNPSWMLQC
jgi:hypothetical protein